MEESGEGKYRSLPNLGVVAVGGEPCPERSANVLRLLREESVMVPA